MNLLLGIINWIKDTILSLFSFAFSHFLDMNLFEKGIIINAVFAFFSITLPIAGFYAFDTWYPINNPFAVYMILIVIIMFVTHYFNGKISFAIRIGLNLYYLAWIIYMGASGTVSAAPYEISAGYLMNILTPLIYAGLSSASYFTSGDR